MARSPYKCSWLVLICPSVVSVSVVAAVVAVSAVVAAVVVAVTVSVLCCRIRLP